MVKAELFAFEILTLLASYISIKHLAASSVVSNIVLVLWLIPYLMLIATSMRVATLIGEIRPESAIITAKTSSVVAFAISILSTIILAAFRSQLAKIFTRDIDLVTLVAEVLPICALYQPFDAVGSNYYSILRG